MDSNKMRSFIGTDFSINKPSLTIYFKSKFKFFFFPISLKTGEIKVYSGIDDLICVNRNWESIDTKKFSTSGLTAEHIRRASELADIMLETLTKELFSDEDFDPKDCWFSSEGLAFASQGDATLNLATYKAIFLQKLYSLGIKNIFTYAPISIKSIAGCSKKEMIKDKGCMIAAFINEDCLINSDFQHKVTDGTLRKTKNYYPGIDDLVDSYWCLKTMYKKERLLGIPVFDDDLIEE